MVKHPEIITKLSEMVRLTGNQKDVADKLGISASYLGELLRGTRTPGPRVLAALGMERNVTYKETKQ